LKAERKEGRKRMINNGKGVENEEGRRTKDKQILKYKE
jgi:hypothetical protein